MGPTCNFVRQAGGGVAAWPPDAARWLRPHCVHPHQCQPPAAAEQARESQWLRTSGACMRRGPQKLAGSIPHYLSCMGSEKKPQSGILTNTARPAYRWIMLGASKNTAAMPAFTGRASGEVQSEASEKTLLCEPAGKNKWRGSVRSFFDKTLLYSLQRRGTRVHLLLRGGASQSICGIRNLPLV